MNYRQSLCVLTIWALSLQGGLSALAAPYQSADTSDYGRTLSSVVGDLAAGAREEAIRKLEATDESLRGFEFDYLRLRAERMTAGSAAPDLILHVPLPGDVESRYEVMDRHHPRFVRICRDGSLRIHSLSNPEEAPVIVADDHGTPVWSGRFSTDGRWFFSGHHDGRVLVRNTEDWSLAHTIQISEDRPVRELAVSPDGRAFVAEGTSALELWSLTDGEPKKVADVGERYNFGEGLAFSPQGDTIATGGMFDIQLMDATNGRPLGELNHASYTMGLQFSPDGKRIASAPRGNVNRFLAVFDVTSKRMLFNDGPLGEYVIGMAFSPDGRRLVATSCEKFVRFTDTETGEFVLELQRDACGSMPAFSESGRQLGWAEPAGFQYIDLDQTAGSTNP